MLFRSEERAYKATINLNLGSLLSETHLVIPHASELLASSGRMPRAHEHWKHCQMDSWSPSILALPKCASSMSRNVPLQCPTITGKMNAGILRLDIVCTQPFLGGGGGGGVAIPFTHHVVQEVPQCGALDSPTGEGNGTPLQYFCLENPLDGGAW